MRLGWVRVLVPEGLPDAVVWRVRIGEAVGGPGDLLAAPEGETPVRVEAELALPGLRAAARLEVTVSVTGDRTTTLDLPRLPPLRLSDVRARYSPPS